MNEHTPLIAPHVYMHPKDMQVKFFWVLQDPRDHRETRTLRQKKLGTEPAATPLPPHEM